ncbi:unnamed protein product [Cuscuta epithymum]|uniref:DDE Tnp4 domain-containing protein n=1 Tax=Cuscuta epithymum TaxID=186058 RepID=A0AAV0DLW9_9ASTE|nr:unnamed protein product [Cuscuta epithymum]CAH9125401.1 unnamed protein product [Cuscuta epithymum]
MQFIYVFPGWEGSAADGRVLRDALTRRFRVPEGCYHLVDGGYVNCEGFLAPYRGQRYHLSEWQNNHLPHNAKAFFNMKHSQARNVIERAYGLLKNRWAILRSGSCYFMPMTCRIIVACDEDLSDEDSEDPDDEDDSFVGADLQPSEAWTTFREDLATEMYTSWIN